MISQNISEMTEWIYFIFVFYLFYNKKMNNFLTINCFEFQKYVILLKLKISKIYNDKDWIC